MMGYQNRYEDSRNSFSNNAPECSIIIRVSSNKIWRFACSKKIC